METLNLLLCDDDETCSAALAHELSRLGKENGILVRIHRYANGMQLLHSYPEKADLVFLDVEMPVMDGIDVGKELRKIDSRVTIIYTTSHAQYAIRGYEVDAFRYLLKPIAYSVLEREILPKMRLLSNDLETRICIRTADGPHFLTRSDINYVETAPNHHIRIHAAGCDLLTGGTLSEFELILSDSRFFKCHASYLVNLDSILSIGKTDLKTADQTMIPISKHRRKDLMETLAKRTEEVF